MLSHSHPWMLWQYRGVHTQLTGARWALQPLHLSAWLWGKSVHLHISSLEWEQAGSILTHAYPYTGYCFAVVFFLLRKVLLVPGLSALEYYFYFITSGSPSANKQGISSSSRQTSWLRISELKAGSKNQLEQCFHWLNCIQVMECIWIMFSSVRETVEWLIRSNHRALSRNICSCTLF